MRQPKIVVAGIGPGSEQDITPAVLVVVSEADVVAGYKYYSRFIRDLARPDAECINTGMKCKRVRAEQAFEYTEQGKTVRVISSGDVGTYGMTPLIYETKRERQSGVGIIALLGISASQKAASLLGAPIGYDFCVISLFDPMTPWERIKHRIIVAAQADFVTAVYNLKGEGCYWQPYRPRELFLQEGRLPETPVGYIRQAGRDEQEIHAATLSTFDPEGVDMFTVTVIGNLQTYLFGETIITPRGYYREIKEGVTGIGQDIMMRNFRTIDGELKNKNIPLDHKWALLHVIHTTADFDMEKLLYTDPGTVAPLYHVIGEGKLKTTVIDATMATSGIRKGTLQRLGVEVKCYLNDEKVAKMAASKGITRTQAGIRLTIGEHPDVLFVFGNVPMVFMELCDLIRKERVHPSGIVTVPIGFVHVQESKHMTKSSVHTPKLIVEDRKGGSNLAVTLINAILCHPDVEQLGPGRDV